MKRSVEGESGRDAHILASAPSLEAAPQRSAGTPHGIGATPWGTKSATRRARFAHVCAGGAPATGVASGANGRATKPTSQGPGVVRGTASDLNEIRHPSCQVPPRLRRRRSRDRCCQRCQRARHKANVTGARRGSRDRYRYGGTTPFKRDPAYMGREGSPRLTSGSKVALRLRCTAVVQADYQLSSIQPSVLRKIPYRPPRRPGVEGPGRAWAPDPYSEPQGAHPT